MERRKGCGEEEEGIWRGVGGGDVERRKRWGEEAEGICSGGRDVERRRRGCGEEEVVHQPQIRREPGPGFRGMALIPVKWRASEAGRGRKCSLVRAAKTVSGFKPGVSTKSRLENTSRPQPCQFFLLYRCAKIRTSGSI